MKNAKKYLPPSEHSSQEEFDELLRLISHDLRGPIRNATAISEIIQEEVAAGNTEEVQRYAALLAQCTSELAERFDAIVESRKDREPVKLKKV